MTEVTTNPAQAKFQIVTATVAPHKCVSCGLPADGRRQFLDFSVSFDYEGALYLCVESCAVAIAQAIGLQSFSQVEELITSVAEVSEQLAAQKEVNRELERQLDAFHTVFGDAVNLAPFSNLAAQIERLRIEVERFPDSVSGELKRITGSLIGNQNNRSSEPDSGK